MKGLRNQIHIRSLVSMSYTNRHRNLRVFSLVTNSEGNGNLEYLII